MTKMENPANFSRRSLLKTGGALVVSIGAPIALDTVLGIDAAHAQASGTKPPLTPDQLSTFIAVNGDGSVSAFFGKMDMGQGLFAAIGQIVAEELDVPFKTVKVLMGDTATSVNQGGASGSTGVQLGGKQMRVAAAEARRVLVEMASQRLSIPADQLTVTDGVVHAKADPSKKASYAELIGGRYFNVPLEWNKELGNTLYAPGKAKPKDPKDYKIVGKPLPREDIAPIVYAQTDFCTDVKRPGMLHARMIRPPVAGSTPVKVDEASIQDIPGAKVYLEKGFLAVYAENEWNAIKASQKLKVEWSNVQPSFVEQVALYDHIRKTPPRKHQDEGKQAGNVEEAFRTAARVVEAEYEWPFQSHASMGPACALVEIQDGNVTCWTGSQKPHFVQNGISRTIDVPLDKVHVVWVVGPGSYGRSDADDAAMDAAVLAKVTGRPVRVQYTRDQGTGWDPKGPASIHRARAALDAQGNIVAYEFVSKGFSRVDVNTNGSQPHDTLAGHFRGIALKSGDNFGIPGESYEFANKKTYWETIPPLLDRASPLRSSHLRDPVGPQIHFASESFMDEIASTIGVDPLELRLRYVKDARDIALLKAVAEKANWQSRPSPRRDQTGNKVSGRGIAYSQRNGTRVAIVAEIEVDRTTGKISVRKFTVAHDCGQIINPAGLKHTIEGNMIQGMSRTIWEETKFDTKNVTSIDWMSYPILDITERPAEIDIVLIDRPNVAPSGAGEPSMRPLSAAIANAIFDATGVRIRRVPFTPESVRQAMS
ncbi:MAG TPA: molybdopterin cofactor-binding domain-containing protein [Xanthobacteraceae bacterium]|nr:molybdopterin cofactor-binding domain-containing protein [Xanthobacteraceae bacterium]